MLARSRSPTTDQGPALQPIEPAWIRAFARGRRVRADVPLDHSPESCGQRNWLDISAAWHRWHKPEVVAGFSRQERPFFLLFDRVRVERLAAGGWPGIASNLADSEQLAPSSIVLRPLYLCARLLADGDNDAARAFVQDWMREHQPRSVKRWITPWLQTFGRSDGPAHLEHDTFDALALILGDLLDLDVWQCGMLSDAGAFADGIRPLVKRCSETLGRHVPDPPAAAEPADQPSISTLEADSGDEDPEAELAIHGQAEPEAAVTRAYPGYTVYSHSLDETAPAARWYRSSDRENLDRLQMIDQRRARQLAHRLQRRLQIARQRSWAFDQEEGLIDSRRLARLVATDNDPRVFRWESDCPVPEACVSLLVDMSGSMRGDRRVSAALALDLTVHVLETCGIQCEVLGYTTRYGEGNPIEQNWQRVKHPDRPGRLNALRHIVFKSARQPWRRCRPYLGLLLREDFGHENIDGEALHWATQRLFGLDIERRILIVLSDGAPFDRATAEANGREFLSDHLRAVIERLDALPMQLLALGTGSDVRRFYRKAVVLREPESVAETLFERLAELLTGSHLVRDSR